MNSGGSVLRREKLLEPRKFSKELNTVTESSNPPDRCNSRRHIAVTKQTYSYKGQNKARRMSSSIIIEEEEWPPNKRQDPIHSDSGNVEEHGVESKEQEEPSESTTRNQASADEDALQDALIQAAEDAIRFVHEENEKNNRSMVVDGLIADLDLRQRQCLRRLDDLECESVEILSKLDLVERHLNDEARRRMVTQSEYTVLIVSYLERLERKFDDITASRASDDDSNLCNQDVDFECQLEDENWITSNLEKFLNWPRKLLNKYILKSPSTRKYRLHKRTHMMRLFLGFLLLCAFGIICRRFLSTFLKYLKQNEELYNQNGINLLKVRFIT